MNQHSAVENMPDRTADHGVGRRDILKITGAGVAALGMTSLVNIPFAEAQDMSNGADNFYKSDLVTIQKVSWKN